MLFSVEAVRVERGGSPILDRLSLSIPEGATAVVGPSGSGKSSFLRLLNRLADPAAGRVRFRGEDVRDLDVLELRRRVALVPQLPQLAEGTVADNLDLAASLAGREADHPELLELAGLDPSFAERPREKLSVGEQQRAMLARALATDPEVLLLDEPTSALDGRAKATVEESLIGLQERASVSVVLVTHEPEQAQRVAEQVIDLEPYVLGSDPAADPVGPGEAAADGAGARG